MESKLKALKVVELKDILTKAGVSIPAKANKPDLIAKIIDTPAALELFELTRGGGDASKYAGTPAGGATPQPPPSSTVSRLASEAPAAPDDLLAPPEPFDWTSGTGTAETVGKTDPASTSSDTLQVKVVVEPISVEPETKHAENSPASKPAEAAPEEEDEEIKKKRLRAERFGIPFVAPKKTRPAKAQRTQSQPQKAPTSQPAEPKKAVNGKGASGARVVVEDDPEKLKKRAERFGVKADVTSAAQPAASKKRAAPEVENVDAEEQERRRKRAERFGLPVKA